MTEFKFELRSNECKLCGLIIAGEKRRINKTFER